MKRRYLCAATVLIINALLWGQSTHTIKKGDTLFAISLRYEVPVEVLMAYNGLSDPSALKIGQALKIPATYEVKPGDTYFGISTRFKLSVDELLQANGRTAGDVLLVGERLVIPSREAEEEKVVEEPEPSVKPEPSPTTVTPAEEENFWPHPGQRSTLTGKLVGEAFAGREGDMVYSVSSGQVVWVSPYGGYGKLIIVESPSKHLFTYGGNESTFVSPGDTVFPGMEIGVLGVSPVFGEAKAFFCVYKNGKPVDPSRAPRG